jgi:Zn-dependent protease with chaperone function
VAEAKKKPHLKEVKQERREYYQGTVIPLELIQKDQRVRDITYALCDRLGLRRPAHVGVSDQLTRSHAQFQSGKSWEQSAIVVGPLGQALSDDLLEAVIAHELGHSRRNTMQVWRGKLVNLLFKLPLTVNMYNRINGWMSQREERAADKFMVHAVGKEKAAALFNKLHNEHLTHLHNVEQRGKEFQQENPRHAKHPSLLDRFNDAGGQDALARYEAHLKAKKEETARERELTEMERQPTGLVRERTREPAPARSLDTLSL